MVLPAGRKDRVFPLVEAAKLVLVCTPDIVSVIFKLVGARVAVAVVVIVSVVFKFATVKLAVIVSLGPMLSVLESGVRTKGWLMVTEGTRTNAGKMMTRTMRTTSRRNAHVGTGRCSNPGFFVAEGSIPG